MPTGVITKKKFLKTHKVSSLKHPKNDALIAIARYENDQQDTAAIVAIIEFTSRGSLIRWEARWGGYDDAHVSRDEIAWGVSVYGFKMSQADAEHFFPRLDGTYYR